MSRNNSQTGNTSRRNTRSQVRAINDADDDDDRETNPDDRETTPDSVVSDEREAELEAMKATLRAEFEAKERELELRMEERFTAKLAELEAARAPHPRVVAPDEDILGDLDAHVRGTQARIESEKLELWNIRTAMKNEYDALPKYSGTETPSQLSLFIEKHRRYFRHGLPAPAERSHQIGLFLEKAAALWWETGFQRGDLVTAEDVFAGLRKRFISATQRNEARTKMSKLQFKEDIFAHNEKFLQLAADYRAASGGVPINEEDVQAAYLNGFTNKVGLDLRLAVRNFATSKQMSSGSPPSLQEMLDIAQLTFQSMQAENFAASAGTTGSPAVQASQAEAGRGNRGNRGGYRGRGGGRFDSTNSTPGHPGERECYNCGRTGHIEYDCRSPCGNCTKPGHTSHSCTSDCGTCGKPGHVARWCRTGKKVKVNHSHVRSPDRGRSRSRSRETRREPSSRRGSPDHRSYQRRSPVPEKAVSFRQGQ